jgi:hypothetical protein
MKTTKLLMTVAALLSAALPGYACFLTPPATSAQSHGLTLDAKSSSRVKVSAPRLQMNRGALELAGSISKQPSAAFTSFSHLDVLFRDVSGRVLQVKPVQFAPRSVGHSRFASKTGHYALKLDSLPEGTARIEVQAHDDDITAPHPQSQS